MPEASRLEYRADLQGLRAIAIGLVLCSHFGFSAFEGGFVGVDVFFVLSGFLITRLLVRELDGTGSVSLARFYARRIRRLFPAMLVMVLAVFAVAVIWFPGEGLKAGLSAAPYAITWASNLYFDLRQLDYFQTLENADYFLHTWSLAIEEQFYLIWPLLLLAFFGPRASASAPGFEGRQTRMALIVGGGFLLCFALQSMTIDSAFYQMPARMWEFAVGGWCALMMPERSSRGYPGEFQLSPRASLLISGAGVGLILISAGLIDETSQHPGLVTVWPVAGAALLIIGGAGENWFSRVLATRPFVWVGDRSYSIYLWHWPVLLLTKGFVIGDPGRAAPLALLLTLLLSMLTYSLIEYPFWKGRFSRSPERLVLSSSLSIVIPGIVLTGVVLAGLNDMEPRKSGFPKSAQDDVPSLYSSGCDDWYRSADVVPCRFGASSAQKSLVYIGDSIGMQWFPAVFEAFLDDGWSVTVFTKSACPIVDRQIYYDRVKADYRVCDQWRSEVVETVSRSAPDLVILGSSSSYAYTDDEWVNGSKAIFSRLAQASDQVLVLPGTPELPFHGLACVERELTRWEKVPAGKCSSSAGIPKAKHVEALLRQAAGDFRNVTVVGVMDLVCPDDTCKAIDQDGLAIYRDQSHLTGGFVRLVAPDFSARLKQHVVDELD